jgi:mannose-1-phosphate guanylyltransferase
MQRETWSIVLAGGEGRRLRALTTLRSGVTVPKQFCSLAGGPSLLAETLRRAAGIGSRERTLVVVSEHHRRFWRDPLRHLPSENVIVQPEGRGTAPGIYLPLLSIVARDPDAEVAVLPSDHHVDDEVAVRGAFDAALDAAGRDAGAIVMLGITPDTPDTQYGWIVPRKTAAPAGPASRIELFVEKPPRDLACHLMARGGLWSSFWLAARAPALLDAFRSAVPELVRALPADLPGASSADPAERLRMRYAQLAHTDFSRDVLEQVPERLRVVPVPPCGWSDLGTPDRIATVVGNRLARPESESASRIPVLSFRLNALGGG